MTSTDVPQLGPLLQVNMPVKNIDDGVAFYRDILGLPFLFQAGNLAFFDCGGVRLLVDVAENDEFAHAGSVLYFRVDDLDAAYEAYCARGVTFVQPPHLVHSDGKTELWMAFFSDGQWNTHALASERPITS
ncbi:MAG: VOC family protein [Dehalococcoidia bacterium]